MTYCTGCGHQIHETAPACPQCGAVQPAAKLTVQAGKKAQGTLWLPVPALVCGLIPVLALSDPHGSTHEQVLGMVMFAVAAIALAGVGLARQERGRGMSIVALVLGVIGLLGAIGSQV